MESEIVSYKTPLREVLSGDSIAFSQHLFCLSLSEISQVRHMLSGRHLALVVPSN